jgi:hypothetical protein
MPIQIPAEATCDHCGKTAPCKLFCCFENSSMTIGKREFQKAAIGVRDLQTWFWKFEGIACSEACKQVLAKDPRWAGYGGQWHPFS